ncbi:MAG: aminotransferase class III-fold pyridoxal phosphate-dependent enzyme [Chloroflexota bacterium]|nr:aminotransferase class III-fold pyridoxal phosphate-dependent enzyme [Chloroflexota bacterium]
MTTTSSPRLTTDEILRLNREYTFFSWSAQAKINPIVIDRAEGVYFWDSDGKRYIDFNSQLMSVNIGHGDARVADAIAEQAHSLAFAAPQFATEVRGRLGQLLAELTPGDLNTFFFTLGGAEANENALRLARLYTGRQKVIARHRSYHGATAGAISVTGDPRRWANESGGVPGVIRVLDPWRWGREEPEPVDEHLAYLEEVNQ